MFQGETAISIDDKGRLAIPTAYRDLVARECGNQPVVTGEAYDYEHYEPKLFPEQEARVV